MIPAQEINGELWVRASDMRIELQRLVELERAECAKVCEVEASVIVTNASEQYQEGRSMGATMCANEIRARGKK